MPHTGTKTLQTKRLTLRRFEAADAEQMFRNWATDPEVTRWMRWEPHADIGVTRAILQGWVQGYQSDETYLWAVALRHSGELIGSIGVLRGAEDGFTHLWEPGYCIGRAFWNCGYTTEALRAVLEYFLQNAAPDELFCCHAKGNPASGRVMEKAGFVYVRDGVYHKFGGAPVEAKFYEYRPMEENERTTD